MALYAVDDDDLIYAGHAEPGKIYWCLDCFGPVKRRRGKNWFPHFYHLKSAPQCRLYSKTDDHLLAQIQLQKLFPVGVIEMERPFLKINRVADLCWESQKIIFEIQCSPVTEKEAEMRFSDYGSIGYDVIWLLDDKRYNKRVIRPAEDFLRRHCTYYMSVRQGLTSKYYDQFEIFAEGQRVRRGKQMPIDLRNVRRCSKRNFCPDHFPKQVIDLAGKIYCRGDRLDRALKNQILAMHKWRGLEIHFAKISKKPSRWRIWLRRYITTPYIALLKKLISKVR